MESINSISPPATMAPVATRPVRSEQGQSRPIVQAVEKAVLPEAKQEAAISEEQLQKALEHANSSFSSEGIGFTYERRLNQLIVQIKDKATGAVVKEVPPQTVIDAKVAMKEMVGILLDRQV